MTLHTFADVQCILNCSLYFLLAFFSFPICILPVVTLLLESRAASQEIKVQDSFRTQSPDTKVTTVSCEYKHLKSGGLWQPGSSVAARFALVVLQISRSWKGNQLRKLSLSQSIKISAHPTTREAGNVNEKEFYAVLYLIKTFYLIVVSRIYPGLQTSVCVHAN